VEIYIRRCNIGCDRGLCVGFSFGFSQRFSTLASTEENNKYKEKERDIFHLLIIKKMQIKNIFSNA
jgi:hypothetical protein